MHLIKYIIDIDNTICVKHSDDPSYELSVPLRERIAKINKLYDDGHEIIYWTARGATSGLDWKFLTEMQLNAWGCKYTEIRMGKPHYDIWIDDKARNANEFFSDVR